MSNNAPNYPSPDATREDIAAWEREQAYDREIAPRLLEISKLCEQHEMNFVAHVEWEPGKSGTTAFRGDNPGAGHRLAYIASRANGNLDRLVASAAADGREHGHRSIYLASLGIPEKPTKAALEAAPRAPEQR